MKRCIIAIFCMSLLSGCANTNLYALSDNYNTDTEIIETEISANAVETEISADTAEDIIIDKDYVANHMLNAVDYYDKAEGTFITSFADNSGNTEVSFIVNADVNSNSVFGYEKVEGEGISFETLSYGDVIERYHHNVKTHEMISCPPCDDDFLAEQSFAERCGKSDNAYHYRDDKIHVGYAAECLMSQNFAFGLLSDFSLWDIDGETEFLGYPVIVVKGTTESKYGGKLGMQSFMLYIEKSSGILMKLEGYDADGNITQYIEMQDIAINKGLSTDKETILKELEEKCGDYEDFNLKNF